MQTTSLKAVAAAAFLALALPGAAHAADLPPVGDTSDWKFTVAAYVWGAGLNGDVGLFGLPPQKVDLPFSDIVKDLNFAFMGLGEARNGRFMLGMDLTYTDVGTSIKSPKGILFDKINYTNTALMATGLVGYALVDNDNLRLDAMVGGRYWSITNDFKIKGGPRNGSSPSDNASWVDPLVGAKLRVDLTSNIYAAGWGMIGGFGVGSDLMWDVMGGAGYKFTDNFSMFGGYRAVSVDYKNDGFVYNVVEQGPVVAAVFQF